MRLSAAAVALATLAASILAIAAPEPARAAESRVRITSDLTFAPRDKYVVVGTTVVWFYDDDTGTPHTVESTTPSEPYDSSVSCPAPPLGTDDCIDSGRPTFRHTFRRTGTFSYRCELHESSGMVGRVIVTERAPTQSASASPTSTRTADPTRSPSVTPSASPTSPSPSPSPSPSGSIPPTPSPTGPGSGDDGGSSGGKIAVAVLALAALGGAAAAVYRSFFARRG